MRFLRRSLIGVFLLAATVGLVAVAGNSVWSALQARWADEPRQRPARERVFAVNVQTITPETITPELTTFGEIRSRRTLDLRASSAGDVVWLADVFEEGGVVTEGQLLARIDPSDAQSVLDVASADLNEAEADLREAERALLLAADDIVAAEDQERLRARALSRQRDLLERGVGTEAAVETAELAQSSAAQSVLSRRQAEASAEARVDQAKTTLERRLIALAEAERGVAETEIYAEFAGVLSEVTIVEGGLVSNNERMAQITDPSALEVSFRVSTPQYARLISGGGQLLGAPVHASVDILGVDLVAEGQVVRESAAVGDGQTGRLLFARLEAAPGFRPGDFVSVKLDEPALENVVKLPASALDAAGGVLVLGEEDRLEAADVRLLRRQGNDVIVRARGLAGREVVMERSPLLGAGIRVRPIRPNADGSVASETPAEPETIALDPERRARLVAFVEANQFMPKDAKERVLAQLQQEQVPARVIARIESRMGG